MRTVLGIIVADHLPGVKTNRLNAHVLALSRIAKPADLIIFCSLDLFSNQYRADTNRHDDNFAHHWPDRLTTSERGIAGHTPKLRHAHTPRSVGVCHEHLWPSLCR